MIKLRHLPIFGTMLTAASILSGHVHAATIADLDLNALSFEVDSLASSTSATGSSNGIGYTLTMDGGSYFTPLSNTNSLQSYNDLPDRYDDLHLNGNFTITFDEEVDSVLFAFANDNNTGDGPDFGLIPTDFTGLSLNGTEISITDIGGALALFEFSSPTLSITSTNWGQTDGWDVSFFAYQTPVSAVPVPAAAFLFAPALLGLIGLRRNKKTV